MFYMDQMIISSMLLMVVILSVIKLIINYTFWFAIIYLPLICYLYYNQRNKIFYRFILPLYIYTGILLIGFYCIYYNMR